MENNSVKTIFDSVEKVFRYLLPGVTFLFLFALSFPSKYDTLMEKIPDNNLALFLLTLAIGMSIYVIHSQVIRFTLEQLVFWRGWSPVNLYTKDKYSFPHRYIRALAELNFFRERNKEHYPKDYYVYLWSMFHYPFIMSELLILFSFWREWKSFIDKNRCLIFGLGVAVLLLSLLSYIYLQLLEKHTTECLLRRAGEKTLNEIRDIIDGHRAELRRVHGVTALAVFGSYVRGEQRRGSDLDLLADFAGPVSLLDLVGAEQYLSGILDVKVDLIPREDVRPELKAGIMKEAVTV